MTEPLISSSKKEMLRPNRLVQSSSNTDIPTVPHLLKA
jgi:hypothetical protein